VRYPDLTASASRALAALLAQDAEYGANANLAMFPLFTGLTPREQAEVARRLRSMVVTVNDVIFREGAVADALYLVKHGQVRLTSPQGVFDLVRPGGFFGEMALLTRNNQNVTAQAVEDSEVLVLDRPHFDAIVSKYPSVSLALSRALGARLEAAEARGSVPMMQQGRIVAKAPSGNTAVADNPYTLANAVKVALVMLPLLWLVGVTAPYWLVSDAAVNPASPLYGILQGLSQ
jgi:CRP-like cAMP-binding protein